jgi:peptide/nickel transport system substrate-binding protein
MDIVTHTAFHEQIRKDVNALVPYWAARFPTADSFLTQFYHSRSIVGTPTGITNFSHYHKIDDFVEKGRMEIDSKRQKALWGDAQKKIIEDAAALPLCIAKYVYARKVSVDFGYELRSTMTLAPIINEITDIRR